MVEWLKAPVLKTGDMKVSVGSNPTLSAKKKCTPCGCIFFFGMDICRVGFERRLLAGCRDASSLLKRKLDYDMLFIKR